MAFLSHKPNTLGFSVVIPKRHYPSDVLELPDEALALFVFAVKKVCKLLEAKLDDVGRVGVILEGFGVDHAHAKLFPMHGTTMQQWQPIRSNVKKYFDRYEGYISSHDYQPADHDALAALAKKIRE